MPGRQEWLITKRKNENRNTGIRVINKNFKITIKIYSRKQMARWKNSSKLHSILKRIQWKF